ncbi:lipoyl(octanoyl) transferase LipB [Candidatus Omnitrophota bacterium]
MKKYSRRGDDAVEIRDLGVVGYADVLRTQNDLLDKRIAGEIPDTLIMVEHDPVVTLGRVAEAASIIDKDFFDKQGISVISTGRGGKITYHAPGQLVLYPILSLSEKRRDIGFYIDFLEKTTVNSLRRMGVAAERTEKSRGVWVEAEKIAFIGVAVKRWVTFHGVAINLNNDITPFTRMHPCGQSDIRVTSAKERLGREVNMMDAKKIFAEQFIKDLEAEYGTKTAGIIVKHSRSDYNRVACY